MTCNLAVAALLAAPPFAAPGRWTPCTYTHDQRAAAAEAIATEIRRSAHMLTTEERARLAAELLSPHSTDHARDPIYGEPA
jgi:hypothetical protein